MIAPGQVNGCRERAAAGGLQASTLPVDSSTWAAIYAAHGWQPIAIRPNDKRPILSGWQTATLEATLNALAANPGANVGIAVPAGYTVLDLDLKNGSDGFASLQAAGYELPDSLTADTPSGGRHIWFKLPAGVTASNRVGILPGVDIRSDGGYVVTVPSVIDGKPYLWNGWNGSAAPAIADAQTSLLELIQKRPKATPAADQIPDQIPEGRRNATMASIGGSLRRAGMAADEIAEALQSINSQRCAPPLDEAEVSVIAASVGRYEYTPPSLASEIFGRVPLPPGAVPIVPEKPRFQLLTAAELDALPPQEWLIPGLVVRRGLLAIVGPAASGKSFLATDLGHHVAAGAPTWFGYRIKGAVPVCFVVLEGQGGISGRAKANRAHHGDPGPSVRYLLSPFRLLEPGDVEQLAAAVVAALGRGCVVIIDTLAQSTPGADENSGVDMGLIVAAAMRLQALIDGLVILIHHTGKTEGKGPRGHSSLIGALDGSFEVARDGDRRTWTSRKVKDGLDGVIHRFTLKVVPVGNEPDEDGVLASSCVVVPDEDAARTVQQVKRPTGGNQRIVYAGLLAALRESGRPEGIPADVPDGHPCLQLETAIDRVADLLTCKADQRGYRARTALTALINGGHFVHRSGWLWLP